MKFQYVILTGLILSGCSAGASLLDSKATVPQAYNVKTGNSLALPPDLQLQTPGKTTDAYLPNGPVEDVAGIAPGPGEANLAKIDPNDPGSQQVAYAPQGGSIYNDAAVPVEGARDVYAEYGISRVKPNGVYKTVTELNNELKAAIIKRKKAKNPNYGTIANIANVFKDE